MRIVLLTLLCTAFSLSLFAQSNYKPGYVIKSNGDTVKGYINYREWNRSPKSIDFKKDIADRQPVFYSATDLKSFQVNGFDNFTSYIGLVSNDKTDITELSNTLNNSTRLDSVFLRVESAGQNVALLYHKDNIKIRYFIAEKGGEPIELVFHQYLNDESKIITVDEYKDQIISLLQKYAPGNAITEIELKRVVSYSDDLIKYIRIINKDNLTLEHTSASYTRLFVGAGISYNILTFDAPAGFKFQTNQTNVSPTITLGIDILSSHGIQKSFFRIEASFVSGSPTFNGAVGYFTSKQLTASLSPQFLINLYNTDKLKFFVGGGVGLAFKFVTDSKLVATQSGVILDAKSVQTKGDSFLSLNAGEYIRNPYSLNPFTGNLSLKTGVIFNKKVELYLAGAPIGFNEASAAYYSYNTKRIVLGFNYLFGSK